MLNQLLLGSTITLVSLTGAALVWWVFNEALISMEPWLKRPPKPAKLLLVVFLAVIATMTMMTLTPSSHELDSMRCQHGQGR